MSFRQLREHELKLLNDEELIAYVVRARAHGSLADARTALGIFAFRRFDDLVRRARLRVAERSDAEDIAAQALRDVLKAAFEGQSVGEAASLISTVLDRRVADFYRAKREVEPLVEPSNGDTHRGATAVAPDESPVVDLHDVIGRCCERFSILHREVIDVYIFQGFDAAEAAQKVNMSFPDLDPPMTDQNVHQIASRFRKALRDDLEGG